MMLMHPWGCLRGFCGSGAGSAVAADVAAAVRPRYHVAGGEQAFFARPPYLNKDLGAGEKACLFWILTLYHGLQCSRMQAWMGQLALTQKKLPSQ